MTFDDIKNRLIESGLNDDAGELTEIAWQHFNETFDWTVPRKDYFYCLDELDNDDDQKLLTGDLYEKDMNSGEFHPFVVLSNKGVPLYFGYTDNYDQYAGESIYDGYPISVETCEKGYTEKIAEKWVKDMVAEFKEEFRYEPFLQDKFF